MSERTREIVYWAVVVVALVLLVVDLAGDGAQAGNVGVMALIAVASFTRKGGWRGPRRRG